MPGNIQDRYGLELSTTSAAAAELYTDGMDQLLSVNAGGDRCFQRAIELDAAFALAHVGLALALQAQGKTDGARASIARAQTLSIGLTRRERQRIDALAAFVAGEGPRALALFREHVSDFPRDALVVLHAYLLLLYGGGGGNWHDIFTALLAPLADSYGDDWWFLSLRSFLLQEFDEFDEAGRLGERSLALYPRNGIAAHALAHVYYETNEHEAGVSFLQRWLSAETTGSGFRGHLSWHQALCALALGHYAEVLELYQRDVGPAVNHGRSVLFDTASLLWRLQLYDCTEETLPWQEVCTYAASPAASPAMPFNAMHAALAFAAVGDQTALAKLRDTLRNLGTKGHPLAEVILLPLVNGVEAFACQRYDEAICSLEPTVAAAITLGGSNAQREVLEDTLVQAYLRAGHVERAQTLLSERLRRRPSARDFFWLGRAEAERGQIEQAGEHLRQARAGWRTADAGSPELAALAGLEQTVSLS